MASTTHEALLAELLGDVGIVHDQIKALPEAIREAVGSAPSAIREATAAAVTILENCAEAQAHWIEQETLKNQETFLQRQREQNDSAHKAMQDVITTQNATLENILVRVGGLTAELVRKEVQAAVAAAIAKTARAPEGTGFAGPAAWGLVIALLLLVLALGAAAAMFVIYWTKGV